MERCQNFLVSFIFVLVFLGYYGFDTEVKETCSDNQLNVKTNRTDSMPRMNVSKFYNVIAQEGADSWVYKHTDGWYYMTLTTGTNVRTACRAIWAPELHFIQSIWYIYFSATTCDHINEHHRMFVIENTNPDPFSSSFSLKGQVADTTDKWAIDGTAFQHPSGQLYFIQSGWQGDVNVRQILYIARMSNPWTISSERVEIARPIYNWETSHQPYINEGPEVTIRNGTISLVYSASGSWTNDYCLGLITASTSNDPMHATSWHKHPHPILQSANNVFGPGHHSFTKSPDGKEDWIIYHSARYSGSGWTRQIRAQQFTWNNGATPNLGEPANLNVPIPIPSGEQVRDRYEAEDTRLLDNPRAIPDSTASNNIKVGYIDYPESTVIFTIQCDKAGTYVIVIRNRNGSAREAVATHLLSINNGAQTEISVVYSGWDMWGASMIRANLKAGANTLTFKKDANYAEIDEIDVFLDV